LVLRAAASQPGARYQIPRRLEESAIAGSGITGALLISKEPIISKPALGTDRDFRRDSGRQIKRQPRHADRTPLMFAISISGQ